MQPVKNSLTIFRISNRVDLYYKHYNIVMNNGLVPHFLNWILYLYFRPGSLNRFFSRDKLGCNIFNLMRVPFNVLTDAIVLYKVTVYNTPLYMSVLYKLSCDRKSINNVSYSIKSIKLLSEVGRHW